MLSYDYLRKRKVWNENTPVSSNMTISTASGQKPLIGLGYGVSMWLVCYCDVSLVFWSICTDLEEDQEPPVLPQRFCYLTLPAWKCICSSSPKSNSIRQAKQTNIQYYNTVTVPLFISHQGFFMSFLFQKIWGSDTLKIPNALYRTLIFAYIPIKVFYNIPLYQRKY